MVIFFYQKTLKFAGFPSKIIRFERTKQQRFLQNMVQPLATRSSAIAEGRAMRRVS